MNVFPCIRMFETYNVSIDDVAEKSVTKFETPATLRRGKELISKFDIFAVPDTFMEPVTICPAVTVPDILTSGGNWNGSNESFAMLS